MSMATRNQVRGWTRRNTIVAGIGAIGVGLAPVARVSAQALGTGSAGIGGGGQVRLATGEATFSLFAERLKLPGAASTIFIGRVIWLDPNWRGGKLLLESTAISLYQPIPGQANGREIHGTMTMNGSGAFPFIMQAFDNGLPGAGQDTISLTVGATATGTPAASPAAATPGAFAYTASGPVVSGDIALVTIP